MSIRFFYVALQAVFVSTTSSHLKLGSLLGLSDLYPLDLYLCDSLFSFSFNQIIISYIHLLQPFNDSSADVVSRSL